MKYRYENFGGIIASDDPPFLAFVDRQYMRELQLPESPRWQTDDEEVGVLSAPLEVHFAVTNRCNVGCPHCYMDAGEPEAGELTTEEFKRGVDALAERGVFHMALGGGEALLRDDLFDIAEYIRAKGMVPNLTISGMGLTEELAGRMKAFGQVNLSLDGVGEASGVFRGRNVFDQVDAALTNLIQAGTPTGINTVLGRRNFDGLADLFAYAAEKELNEVEILRLKPAGRCGDLYNREKTTPEQNESLIPTLSALSAETGVTAKIDCSFVPMLCFHKPALADLEAMAVYGCEAGNVLLGIRADGRVGGCSFLPGDDLHVLDLADEQAHLQAFSRFINFPDHAPQPCASCDYLSLCKGGCRAVSMHAAGNAATPDPDCPFVIRYNKETAT